MTVGPVRTASSDGSRKLSRYWTGDRPSGEIANLAPQHFPDQAPFLPYSGAHNSRGRGVSEDLKKLCSFALFGEPL